MKLHIFSPETSQTYNITWIEIFTPHGNMIIKPEHAPTVQILIPGKPLTFKLKTGKKESVMLIRKGILEVGRTSATAILNKIA